MPAPAIPCVESFRPSPEPTAKAKRITPEETIGRKAQACAKLAAKAMIEREKSPLAYNKEGDVPFKACKIYMSNILGNMRKIKDNIHRTMDISLYRDLDFAKLIANTNELLSMIEAQAKEPLPPSGKVSGERVEIPEREKVFVDNATAVSDMLDNIYDSADILEGELIVGLDLEGTNLGRDGTIAIITVDVAPINRTFLVDVFRLGGEAFTTPATKNAARYTLKQLLEGTEVRKLLWDCRSDGDALWHRFGVRLACVTDVQLEDIATRKTARERKNVKSLSHAAPQRLALWPEDTKAMSRTQEWGGYAIRNGMEETRRLYMKTDGDYHKLQTIFADEWNEYTSTHKGETMPSPAKVATKDSPFDVRPLESFILDYCVSDVALLLPLHQHFESHRYWNAEWAKLVEAETQARLDRCLATVSRGPEEDMRAAPESWRKITQVEKTPKL